MTVDGALRTVTPTCRDGWDRTGRKSAWEIGLRPRFSPFAPIAAALACWLLLCSVLFPRLRAGMPFFLVLRISAGGAPVRPHSRHRCEMNLRVKSKKLFAPSAPQNPPIHTKPEAKSLGFSNYT